MRNTGLEEAEAGIKIAGRNVNNLRYADDTTLMAESEEELKSLLMKVKEESEKVGLKLNILFCPRAFTSSAAGGFWVSFPIYAHCGSAAFPEPCIEREGSSQVSLCAASPAEILG